jgi:hypothetical protein
VIDQHHAVAEPFGLVHEVGDQHHRHPAVADAFDQVPGVAARLRVQSGGELVQDGVPTGSGNGAPRLRDPRPELSSAGIPPHRSRR